MQVEIRWKATAKSRAVEDCVHRSAGVFRCFAPHTQTVVLCFEAPNGRTGKRCTVELKGTFGVLRTTAVGGDFRLAAERALVLAGRSLRRILDERGLNEPT